MSIFSSSKLLPAFALSLFFVMNAGTAVGFDFTLGIKAGLGHFSFYGEDYEEYKDTSRIGLAPENQLPGEYDLGVATLGRRVSYYFTGK